MFNKLFAFVTGLFKGQKLDKWDSSRATNTDLLKEWNKGRAKEFSLQERFVTASGDVYYSHKNIGELGIVREAKLRELVLKTAFAATPARIAKHEKDLDAATAAKNTNEIIRLSAKLCSDMRAAPELLALCELGALLLFRHDERPDTFNAAIHADKVRQMQLDDNAQFFFAYTGWAVIHQTLLQQDMAGKLAAWKLTNEDDFHDYLQERAAKLKAQK